MKTFLARLFNKIKQSNKWCLVGSFLLSIIVITSTVLLAVFSDRQTVLHIVLYVLSFISFLWIVILFVLIIPHFKIKIKNFMSKNKYTNKFITSYGFRTFISAILSLILNLGYAMFIGILAIISKSPWLTAFAVYYLILSLMRGSVLWSKKKRVENEENTYLGVAISLLILTLLTAVIVTFTYKYSIISKIEGLLVYAAAAYTFYKLGISISNIIKAKKQESLLVEAVKDISFVDALVSIFVLQVTMIQVFATDNLHSVSVLNGITGLLVCLGSIAVAVLMIVKVIKIKALKRNNVEKVDNKDV